eukprot:tig00001065_g6736.t1
MRQLDRVHAELLLKRTFVNADGQHHEPHLNSDAVLPGTIRVMQYNVLADHYAAPGDFPAAPAAILDWGYRRWKLLEELLVREPDVLCMQEVDAPHFAAFWEPELALAGYEGVFEAKGDGRDGSALFFKRARFSLAARRRLEFRSAEGKVENQVGLLAALEPAEGTPAPGRLAVGVVHLKASEECELVRERQVTRVLDELEAAAADWRAPATLLAGDFNSHPDWPTYRRVYEHGLRLRSAYAVCADAGAEAVYERAVDAEPPLTTAKFRDASGKGAAPGAAGPALKLKACVEDYIFSSPALRVARVLALPPLAALGPGALPSPVQGSDHLALVADFRPARP